LKAPYNQNNEKDCWIMAHVMLLVALGILLALLVFSLLARWIIGQ
jgi:hypothetical protein